MVKYRWKELGLISIQTLSNIITFIQFALIPLDLLITRTVETKDKIEQFITMNFGIYSKIFTAPFDLNRQFQKIISPLRTTISSVAVFACIGFLYNIFFQPSWYFILLFADLFIPGTYFYGFTIIRNKKQRKIGIVLIVIGSLYLILRFLFFIFSFCERKKKNGKKWHIKNVRLITAVFLSRLKKDKSEEQLNEITEKIHTEIDKREYNIQFDDCHFSFKKRIIDFCVTFSIWLFLLIFVILGWKRILCKQYKGRELDDISTISNVISYVLFSGICVRLIINIIWLIDPIKHSVFHLFIKLKRIAYKGIIFLTSISIFPILKMALTSTSSVDVTCNWYQYYDSRSNTNTFIEYFMERDGSYCVNCSKISANSVWPCNYYCYFDPDVDPLYATVMADSRQILSNDFRSLYLPPILLLALFYLSVFNLLMRQIYSVLLQIVNTLPSPTINIECKFQTLLNTLIAPGVNIFRSYCYNSALYNFNFTQSKLFILFFINIVSLQLVPIESFQNNPFQVICWVFTISNFVIALVQFFSKPYISILHNIVNFVSYLISGIVSLFISLHVCNIMELSSKIGNALIVIIVIAPILTALITPFFAKKDPILAPTEFDLIKIQKWDKKLNQLIHFKVERMKALLAKKEKRKINNDVDDDDNFDFENDGILVQNEPSISISYYQTQYEDDREHDGLIGQFNLLKLAPIQVQEGINYSTKENNVDDSNQDFRRNCCSIWCKKDILEKEFDAATNEMLDSSNKIIDCISFNNLVRLIHFSIIFSSACLGWCLGSGINRWNKIHGPNASKYYYQCNMFENGTYPSFGTY